MTTPRKLAYAELILEASIQNFLFANQWVAVMPEASPQQWTKVIMGKPFTTDWLMALAYEFNNPAAVELLKKHRQTP